MTDKEKVLVMHPDAISYQWQLDKRWGIYKSKREQGLQNVIGMAWTEDEAWADAASKLR